MDNQSYVNLIQKKYRGEYLQLLDGLYKDYDKLANMTNTQIANMVNRYKQADGRFRKSDLRAIQDEISAITYNFGLEIESLLTNNIEDAVRIASEGQDEAIEGMIRQMIGKYKGNEKALLEKVYANPEALGLLSVNYGQGLPAFIREKAFAKRWADGVKLSDRIWGIERTMRENLHKMVEQCISEGLSAVEFSKAVDPYLKVSGPKWTTKIKPAITSRGSVKYNALRLARAETNNAYWLSQQIFDQESILVKGTKRNLSGSHPNYPPSYAYKGYQEICDYYALANHSGLGPGVFEAGRAEPDHVQGLCFLTSIVLSGNELLNILSRKYSI